MPGSGWPMDFSCTLPSGKKIIVEVQIIPQNFWDKSQLVYAANVHAPQIKAEGKWQDINRVISIAILGGNRAHYWNREFKKHHIMKDICIDESLQVKEAKVKET